MFKWIPYAMVRITLFFAGGIMAGIGLPGFLEEDVAQIMFAILCLVFLITFLILKRNSSLGLVSGFTGLIAIFMAGYLNLVNKTDSNRQDHFSHVRGPIEYYYCLVRRAPEEKANSRKVEIEMIALKTEGTWRNVTGKSLLYVYKKSTPADLLYGDRILVKGSPVEIPSPHNPGEFDLKRFLSFKNISHQHFVRNDQIILVGHTALHGILFYSQLSRAWATFQIEKFISGTREQAITKALILGVTDGLDNDLLGAYAASGAMHILSVSGLHVGIIYGMILLLLKPLRHHSWSRWLLAALTLVCLWSYAFITGLSPSVLRAVAMFSFMAIANPFGRQTNIYNTLAASAFLLLIYDPYLIMSVGFQLSYLAVTGIVYLQRPLYNLWEPSFWLWDKVWQVLCVSLAAQLATFALGLYYFHQFPVYFLLSNLAVIPLSSLVLVVGILLLAVSAIPVWAAFIGILLQFLIGLLNGSVFFVEGLPWSLIEGVQLTAMQCGLLLAMVVAAVLLLEHRKFQFALASLFLILLFSALQWSYFFKEIRREQMIVYDVPGHGALEWIENGQSFFYADPVLVNDKDQVRFHLAPCRVLSGVSKINVNAPDSRRLKTFSGFRFFVHGQVSVLWIEANNCDLPGNARVDYLMVGNDAVRSLEDLLGKIRFKQLIIDSSNSRFYTSRLVREAESRNIKVHSVAGRGAFRITL